ncbi:MAG: hypothetical protein IJL06_08795 [Kiritimatiellae bacterium]|nr:hypothetical protein [Kiritimatiellia bacterium]
MAPTHAENAPAPIERTVAGIAKDLRRPSREWTKLGPIAVGTRPVSRSKSGSASSVQSPSAGAERTSRRTIPPGWAASFS